MLDQLSSRLLCRLKFCGPHPPLPNRLLTPLLDDELVVLRDAPPNSEASAPPPLPEPPAPESLTELAVIVPLLPLIPSTTTESPGWIALAPTPTDFVIFDDPVVTTATVFPLVSVT
jgi:hypothetical protein